MNCYKILRSNLTDCHSGTKDFVGIGATTVENSYDGWPKYGNGLHACYKPHDCISFRNGIWPVRLFKAEVPDDGHVRIDDCKLKAREMTLLEELPIAQLWEFNGDQLAVHMERIMAIKWWQPEEQARDKVTDLCVQHMQRLQRHGLGKVHSVKFLNGSRSAARGAAWNAVREASRAAAWGATKDAAWAAARAAARDAARGATRAAAWDAARSAEYIVVSDLVDWPSPWEPLVGVWELGYEPIGVYDGQFWVWEPEIITVREHSEQKVR